jgi:hypothetical protein
MSDAEIGMRKPDLRQLSRETTRRAASQNWPKLFGVIAELSATS